MPRSGTSGFIVPSAGEQLDWHEVVKDMLDGTQSGACASIPLPPSLVGLYEITAFTDASSGDTYCVLAEVAEIGDLDKNRLPPTALLQRSGSLTITSRCRYSERVGHVSWSTCKARPQR